MSKTLLVSPHFDDVAFSVGAMALRGMLGEALTVVTVFSISNFAPLYGSNCSTEAISKLRKKEDLGFTTVLGATPIELDMTDALLRYPNIGKHELVNGALVDEVIVPALARSLNTLALQLDADLVVAPIGYGGHIDHVTVRSACGDLVKPNVLFYLDQPYAGAVSCDFALPGYRRVAELLSSRVSRREKQEIASFYPSQPAAARMGELIETSGSGDILESLWKACPP